MTNDLGSILIWKYPGQQFNCGATYDTLEWYGNVTKPTLQEVQAADIEFSAHLADTAYIDARRQLYPSYHELIEVLATQGVAGLQSMISTINQQVPAPEAGPPK